MNKLRLLLAGAVLAPLVAAGPAAASHSSARATSGQVRLTVHSHSSGNLLFPATRLSYDFAQGDTFSYSSLVCRGNAPFNNIGLDFIPDYPGVDDAVGTASVRHHVEGTVTSVHGNRGVIEGTITSVLCAGPVESEHRLVTHFQVSYIRVSDNDIRLSGAFRFSPTESTGTFEDIVGGGRIQGVLTCLGHMRSPSTSPSCAQLGEYHDFVVFSGDPRLPAGRLQPGLTGSYFDPTTTISPAAA